MILSTLEYQGFTTRGQETYEYTIFQDAELEITWSIDSHGVGRQQFICVKRSGE